MTLPVFDTHAYVKRLKESGFSEQQAEALAELQSQVLSGLVTEKFSTKIKYTTEDSKSELKEEYAELKSEINKLRAALSKNFKLAYWMVGFLLACEATILFKVF